MKTTMRLLILLACAPLLTAAIWMDRQPSPKPYQAPIMIAPPGSVPITGREMVSQSSELKNPLPATADSLERGKQLFNINCDICHGQSSAERGAVGKKLKPPPPGLGQAMLLSRSDAHIFKAVTFGFGRMPPFRDKLTPSERWELVNFLRTRK